ncbi:MAG: hypothetical protein DYG85_06365 [Chloroflexi bacterium CFX1]|nr:hypothetical protein Rctr41k_23 [Virus Rctr41k]MCE7919128.1 hypothetical protein [Chloroflexi bacterium CFX1]
MTRFHTSKEKIRAGDFVVFDEDGARLLNTSFDFKVVFVAARNIEAGEVVEYSMVEDTKDFICPRPSTALRSAQDWGGGG